MDNEGFCKFCNDKRDSGRGGGVMIRLGMRKRGTGPLSLETCPLPEEPRMNGFLKCSLNDAKYGKSTLR